MKFRNLFRRKNKEVLKLKDERIFYIELMESAGNRIAENYEGEQVCIYHNSQLLYCRSGQSVACSARNYAEAKEILIPKLLKKNLLEHEKNKITSV